MGNWSAEGSSLGSGRIAVVFMLRLCGCAAGDTNLCEPQVGKLQVDIRLVGEGSAEVWNMLQTDCKIWFGNCLGFLIPVSKELG